MLLHTGLVTQWSPPPPLGFTWTRDVRGPAILGTSCSSTLEAPSCAVDLHSGVTDCHITGAVLFT